MEGIKSACNLNPIDCPGVLLLCAYVLLMKGRCFSIKATETDDDVYIMPGWSNRAYSYTRMRDTTFDQRIQAPYTHCRHVSWFVRSNQRMRIANAIATAIKKRWRLVLPDLRFNYPEVSILFTEPFDFFFDISALQPLSSYGYYLSALVIMIGTRPKSCHIKVLKICKHGPMSTNIVCFVQTNYPDLHRYQNHLVLSCVC